MQVLEQRYYWLSPCSMAQAVQQLASALHEDETINPRQVWELLLWWCIREEYCITLSTHVNTSSAFHCASLCMCVVTAAIWDETKTWCKAGFFHANSVAFDLTWIGCVSQLACHALPVMVRLRLYGSWAFVGKKHCWLSEASFLTSTPVLLPPRSLMLWLIPMHLVSMHLSNQITYQFTDKSCSKKILLEHHCWPFFKCRMFWVQTDDRT